MEDLSISQMEEQLQQIDNDRKLTNETKSVPQSNKLTSDNPRETKKRRKTRIAADINAKELMRE